MKKIIHFFDVLNIGGAQTQLLSVLPSLDGERYEHIIYSMTDKTELKKEFEDLGFIVKSLYLQDELKSKKWIGAIKKIVSMLNSERPDIVETHQTWSRLLIVFSLPWIHKKPRIITIIQGEEYNNTLHYKAANFFASIFIDRMITCSENFKKWLVKNYGIPSKKIVVMHNTVSLEKFKASPERRQRSRSELGIKDDEIAIVSIGQLGFRTDKGMKYCIDAMDMLNKKYNNLKLIIVGEGARRPDLEREIENIGLKDKIKLIGARRDTPYILDGSDIFVLASPFEPFGIVFIEAMAMEKPVGGSNAGGIPEVIKDSVTGFLAEPRNPQDFARAVERLILDKELRLEMGKLAREDVEKRFNAVNYAKKLQDIYESLAGQ